MNPTKSELIVFRSRRQNQELSVQGQPEATKVKLLGVLVDKGYSFNSHSISVAASVRNKVEKLSTVVKYLNMTNRKRITESIVISTLSYCLALWGFKKKWRRKCQKAMNTAIRMILETDNRYSITDGLALLEWPNMDNLWRLEQINVMRRITQTQIPTSVYSIITGRTQGRYLIRADGIRST